MLAYASLATLPEALALAAPSLATAQTIYTLDQSDMYFQKSMSFQSHISIYSTYICVNIIYVSDFIYAYMHIYALIQASIINFLIDVVAYGLRG